MSGNNLAYYLAHPDEMPEDPKEIERLTREYMDSAMTTGEEQVTVERFLKEPKHDPKADSSTAGKDGEAEAQAKADADKATAKAEAEAAVAAQVATQAVEDKVVSLKLSDAALAAKADAEAKGKPWVDGILTKDGKQVLPYAALTSARSRAEAAETLAKEQAEEIARLKTEKTPVATDDVQMLTAEELDALEADSPILAKTLRAQQAAYTKLAAKVDELSQTTERQVATQEAEVKSEIQTAIDANPTLAAWQSSEDQTIWAEASRFDKLLRESPRYANVSFEDRFAKVVELTQTALGIEVAKPDQEPKPDPLPTLTPEQIKAAAAAKLKTKVQVPTSLSQIPGGAPPAVDEREKVEQMSAVALGQQFLGMTKEQMDAYLSSL